MKRKAPKQQPKKKRSSRRSNQGSQQRIERLNIPAAMSGFTQVVVPMKFTAAPAHDHFPNGGLRLVGSTLAQFSVIAPTSLTRGIVGTGGFYADVSPNGGYYNGSYHVSGGLIASNFGLAGISTHFMRFRFNYLRLRYVPSITTAPTAQNVAYSSQIWGYEADPTCDIQIDSGNKALREINIESSNWTPWSLEAINDRKRSERLDRELFWINQAGDSQTDIPSARSSIQGCIVGAAVDLGVDTSAATMGRIHVDFEVDLYGWCDNDRKVNPVEDSKRPANRTRPAGLVRVQDRKEEVGAPSASRVLFDEPEYELPELSEQSPAKPALIRQSGKQFAGSITTPPPTPIKKI